MMRDEFALKTAFMAGEAARRLSTPVKSAVRFKIGRMISTGSFSKGSMTLRWCWLLVERIVSLLLSIPALG